MNVHQQESFDDLLEALNRALMDSDPKDPPPLELRKALHQYHFSLYYGAYWGLRGPKADKIVADAKARTPTIRGNHGSEHHHARLDTYGAKMIRRLHNEGWTYLQIQGFLDEEDIEVSECTISRVVRGKVWKAAI